jgi:hypothetical protein
MSQPPTRSQPKIRNAKASGYIFTNKSIYETLSTASPQPLKELPDAQYLLAQFSLNIPSHRIPLPAISAALLEFITTAPSLTQLQSDILKALFVVLNNVVTNLVDTTEGPQTATQDHMTKLATLLEH